MRRFEFGLTPWGMLPPAVKNLLVGTLAMFVLDNLLNRQLSQFFALVPSLVWTQFQVWRPVTYLFFHGSVGHLLFNGLVLWFFGAQLENAWGTREFLRYFLITGVGAGLVYSALFPFSGPPLIGMSACDFAILIAFALANPQARVLFFFILDMTVWQMVWLLIALELLFTVSREQSLATTVAHLGGLGVGWVYLRWWSLAKLRLREWAGGMRRPGLRGGRRIERSSEPEDLTEEVDRILDKISRHGQDSLSADELETLKKHSRRLHDA